MKKTVSLVLALMLALVAVFSLSMMAFADGEDGAAADTATTSTTAAPSETRGDQRQEGEATTTTTTKPATTTANILDKLTTTTTLPNSAKEDDAEIVTNAPGQTAIVDEPANTTRKAASTDTYVPNTGSSVVLSAVAVLAVMAGTVAVVKTKKDN